MRSQTRDLPVEHGFAGGRGQDLGHAAVGPGVICDIDDRNSDLSVDLKCENPELPVEHGLVGGRGQDLGHAAVGPGVGAQQAGVRPQLAHEAEGVRGPEVVVCGVGVGQAAVLLPQQVLETGHVIQASKDLQGVRWMNAWWWDKARGALLFKQP